MNSSEIQIVFLQNLIQFLALFDILDGDNNSFQFWNHCVLYTKKKECDESDGNSYKWSEAILT